MILFLVMLRPTFYYYGYHLGRISDFLSFFIVFASLILLHRTFKKSRIDPFMSWFGAYLLALSVSYYINNLGYALQIKDFAEWFRPVMLMSALLFGFSFFGGFRRFLTLNILIVLICLVSSVISVIEYFGKGSVFYVLFSVPNLFLQGRPGGIAYSHVEYSFISLVGFASSIYLFTEERKRVYMFTAAFLLATSVLSLSKAGFLGATFYASFCMLFLILNRRVSLIYKLALPSLFIPIIYYLYVNIPYIYWGLQNLIHLDFYSSVSIYHRFLDYAIGYDYLVDNPVNFLIGYTPLRGYPDVSYIEVSAISVLFRYGVLGAIVYYFPYAYFTFSNNRKPNMVLFKMLFITIVLSDFTANVSENIKLSTLLFVLFGSMLSLKHEDEYNHSNL